MTRVAFVHPLRDWIAVRPDASLHPLLHVPAANRIVSSREQIAHTGTVLACGPGDYPVIDKVSGQRSRTFVPMAVQPGDRIRFGEWSYQQVDTRGGPVWLIQQGDVVGVMGNESRYVLTTYVLCRELMRLMPGIDGLLVVKRHFVRGVVELVARHPDAAPTSVDEWSSVRHDEGSESVPRNLCVNWLIPAGDLYRSLDEVSDAYLVPFARAIRQTMAKERAAES